MEKVKFVFKVVSTIVSLGIGFVSIINDIKIKRKNVVSITENDKDDVADKVVIKLKNELMFNNQEIVKSIE